MEIGIISPYTLEKVFFRQSRIYFKEEIGSLVIKKCTRVVKFDELDVA